MRLVCSLIFFALLAKAEPADWVLTARYIVTADPQHRILEHAALAVRNGKIEAVGPAAEINRRYQPKHRLDRPDALIAPGLINTHTHAAMSLLRGIGDDRGLQDWLENFIFPAEAHNVTPEFVRWGTRLACLEMLLGGTTTFTDMYYFEEVAAEVTKEAGMRGVLGETIIGFPVADAKTPAEALQRASKFLDTFGSDPLVVPAVAPHAIYTNTAETLKAARDLANRFHAPLIIHLSETKKEFDDSIAQHGATPTAYLDSLGFFNGRTVAAHAVWLTDSDIQILKVRNTGIAHCPSSNMKLASGAAPVTKLLAAGVNVGLGPDGPASNNDLNLFEEMDLAAKLQKLITMDPEALPARAALDMATINGARVFGLEAKIGSLEPGKQADLITVRLDGPNAIPLYNVESQLVYALKANDVADVMVAGKWLVRDGKCLTLN
ncbi:MAG: amidohydrolase family protein, partial [Acidobacteriota bacterium]|nr:amidohydrolase family protein [Acidobacteriota bacterium]